MTTGDNVAYIALSRLAWGLVLCWVVLVCASGQGWLATESAAALIST